MAGRLHLPLAATLILLSGLATPAAARRVIVPDGSPTIQLALDIDMPVDTIAVRDGVPPERLTLSYPVVLERAEHPDPNYNDWTSAPTIQSLEVMPSLWTACGGFEVHGFRFLGQVKFAQSTEGRVTLEGCRFDSSFSNPGTDFNSFMDIKVLSCMIFGPVSVSGYVQFLGNTVIGGTVYVWADGNHDIRNNYIQGPAGVGLQLSLTDSYGEVAMNTIRGTTTGISCVGGSGGITDNDIADCPGDGIYGQPSYGLPAIESNTIVRCGGAGISVHATDGGGFIYCDSNRIVQCGGEGIGVRTDQRYGRPVVEMKGNVIRNTGRGGIVLGQEVLTGSISGNVILDAGADGISAEGGENYVEKNVVGRSRGAGILLAPEPYRVVGNTVFSNGGAGIQLVGGTADRDSLINNIAAFNVGPGFSVEVTGAPHTAPPQLGCNDSYANLGGACVGIAPGATDLTLDPQFCNLPSADVHLAATSPLLAAAGCGLIGALGQGCAASTAVEEPSAPLMKRFHAWPVPARGGIAFEVPPSAGAAMIEVFDVTGARRWESTVPAGATRLEWNRRDRTGRRAAPGVYFARLRCEGSRIETTRIVLAE